MIEYILWFLLVCTVLFVIIGLWIAIHYWLDPHVASPDGKARITGACRDTMEICLKFEEGRVVESAHWTDGCTVRTWRWFDVVREKKPSRVRFSQPPRSILSYLWRFACLTR